MAKTDRGLIQGFDRHESLAWTLAVLLLVSAAVSACGPRLRQVPDLEFRPSVAKPSFASGDGPLVLIDEAHFNFHTVDGRYRSFAELLRRDGYRVEASSSPFGPDFSDLHGDVLVIANSLARVNANKWELPTPSAFSDTEIDALEAWIQEGGSLLLIADHMPFPGATGQLAESLGALLINGYAFHDTSTGPLLTFERTNGSLAEHAITRGRNWRESVQHVVSSF